VTTRDGPTKVGGRSRLDTDAVQYLTPQAVTTRLKRDERDAVRPAKAEMSPASVRVNGRRREKLQLGKNIPAGRDLFGLAGRFQSVHHSSMMAPDCTHYRTGAGAIVGETLPHGAPRLDEDDASAGNHDVCAGKKVGRCRLRGILLDPRRRWFSSNHNGSSQPQDDPLKQREGSDLSLFGLALLRPSGRLGSPPSVSSMPGFSGPASYRTRARRTPARRSRRFHARTDR
jgi:hypothetical protein